MDYKKLAVKLGKTLAKEYGPAAAEYLHARGTDYLEHLAQDPDEAKKHCAVCGRRIKWGAKFHATHRFYCSSCGHRTHVGCAADLRSKT